MGGVNPWVNAQRFSFEICTTEGRGRGRKERECKFQNKAHRTFDPRINSTPVDRCNDESMTPCFNRTTRNQPNHRILLQALYWLPECSPPPFLPFRAALCALGLRRAQPHQHRAGRDVRRPWVRRRRRPRAHLSPGGSNFILSVDTLN